MLLPSERIIKKYPTLLRLLKFVIRNDDDPEFQSFYLVNSYIEVLKKIENNLNEIFNNKVKEKESLELDEILFSFFKEEVQNYKDYLLEREAINKKIQDFKQFINNEEKRDLIKKFELVMELTDMAYDRNPDDKECGGLWYLKEVDKELNNVINSFQPILKKMENQLV